MCADPVITFLPGVHSVWINNEFLNVCSLLLSQLLIMCSAICVEIVPCLPLLFDCLLSMFAVYMATELIAVNCC